MTTVSRLETDLTPRTERAALLARAICDRCGTRPVSVTAALRERTWMPDGFTPDVRESARRTSRTMSASVLRCTEEVVVGWSDAVLGVCACAGTEPSVQIVMARAAIVPVILLLAPLVFTVPPVPFIMDLPSQPRVASDSEAAKRDTASSVFLARLIGLYAVISGQFCEPAARITPAFAFRLS